VHHAAPANGVLVEFSFLGRYLPRLARSVSAGVLRIFPVLKVLRMLGALGRTTSETRRRHHVAAIRCAGMNCHLRRLAKELRRQ
jgi:hypothetical protein